MNKIYQIFLLIICLLFFGSHLAHAQNKAVKIVVASTVTDQNGRAIEGVNITNDKGRIIGTTGSDGRFSFEVPINTVLHINHKGFKGFMAAVENMPDKIVLIAVPFLAGESDKIPVPFGEIKKRETVGASYSL